MDAVAATLLSPMCFSEMVSDVTDPLVRTLPTPPTMHVRGSESVNGSDGTQPRASLLRLVPCHFHREHATLSPPAHPLLLRCWLIRSVGVWRAVKVSPHLRLNASQFLRISYASIVHSNGYHTYAVSRSIAPHLPSIVSHTLRSFFGHTTLPNRVVC
jgi:hypothetical protein